MPREGGCYIWLGAKSGRYGAIYSRLHKKQLWVHRIIYEACNGPIPEGLVIRHKCDNPLCVNPTHLEVGTQSQNCKDAYDRGRRPMKLNKAVCDEIRRRVEAGDSFIKIGRDLGLSEPTVARAVPDLRPGSAGSDKWLAAKFASKVKSLNTQGDSNA